MVLDKAEHGKFLLDIINSTSGPYSHSEVISEIKAAIRTAMTARPPGGKKKSKSGEPQK